MAKVLFLILFFAFSVPAVLAQDDYNKYDIYAGFSHNRVDIGDTGGLTSEREGFNGFEAAVKGNVSRYVGLKGDYSFHRKTFSENIEGTTFEVDANLHNILGGVEFKDNSKEKRVKPFAHFLAGIVHAKLDVNFAGVSESDTAFAMAIGGGIDIRLGKRADFRIIQVDYNPTRLSDETQHKTQHDFRIGIGIVFR